MRLYISSAIFYACIVLFSASESTIFIASWSV